MDVDCSDLDSGAEAKEEEKTQVNKNENLGTLLIDPKLKQFTYNSLVNKYPTTCVNFGYLLFKAIKQMPLWTLQM